MKINKCYLLLHIFLTIEYNICGEPRLTEVIQTDEGPVQGEIFKTIRNSVSFSAFRGIRYAKAPVGYRRFRPPEEAEHWSEVFQATSEGLSCPQLTENTYIGDEDCLNLNVYTPLTNFSNINSNDSLLSVMVWIYGGKYLYGSSDMSFYGPDYLIEEGVIVVAMNYRLGALGFLSLNLPNATGNAALKDQLLALKWVQRNIKSFGGNPNRVTIFGLSVGGAAVDYHTLSDASIGLFHRSISMSGVALCFWALNSQSKSEHYAFKLAEVLAYNVKDKESLLTMLYNESAENIVRATSKITSNLRPFTTVIEDKNIAGTSAFLTECFINKLKSGKFNRVPHMIGHLASEAISLMPNLTILKKVTQAVSNESKLSLDNFPVSLIDSISNIAGGTPDTIFYNVINKAINDLIHNMTDYLYTTPIDIEQQLIQKYSPVYYYRTTITPKAAIHKIKHIDIDGAAHGDDLAYIWNIRDYDFPTDPADPFIITRDRLTRLITNFAKYADPTPEGLNDPLLNVSWPVSGSKGQHLEIGIDLTVKQRPIDSNIKNLQPAYLSAFEEFTGCCT